MPQPMSRPMLQLQSPRFHFRPGNAVTPPLYSTAPDLGRLDGTDVGVEIKETIDADDKISFKVLSEQVSPGPHTLTMETKMRTKGPYGQPLALPEPGAVECIFNMSDLYDGAQYLGAFLPANYCYDQFKMSFTVTISNATLPHIVFSNGDVSGNSTGPWKIEFPGFFNSACPWFHLGPENQFQIERFTFSSPNVKRIPITVYARNSDMSNDDLEQFVDGTQKYLRELDSSFGPFHMNR